MKARGEGDNREWDGWMASLTQWTWIWASDRQEGLACCSPWGSKELDTPDFGHLMRRVDSLEKTLMLGGVWAGGEGDDRGWDGWMASLTRWTWVWVNSGSWWWAGRPGVLRFMGSQRVGHDWVTELNWTELRWLHWDAKAEKVLDLCFSTLA